MDATVKRKALGFVLLMGVVSLFADMTYESARSITGPFMEILGASAAAVGFVAGLGELIGYGLRLVTGLLSDRTGRYWLMAITGYAINLLAVPAMALAGSWEIAAALIMTERLGKAIRSPAKDAILSHAAQAVGRGWGFGLHEAMDQIGAMTGPLIVTLVLATRGSYQYAFAVLAIPAGLALLVLALARFAYPNPEKLEKPSAGKAAGGSRRVFWLYLAAVGCLAAGFADYPLIAYHLKSAKVLADKWIPLLYSLAMGVDALAALVVGRYYDKIGLPVLMAAVAGTAWFAPLAFSTGPIAVAAGMVLWGAGLGAQESVVRAVVADLVPKDRRATGYGMFNTGFGLAWFAGSAVMGLLYDWSPLYLVVFSIVLQLASLPLLYRVRLAMKQEG